MLDSLLSDLECEARKVTMPKCSIDTEELLSKPDLAWQDRVNAAAHPIPHWLGSYGPLAYSTAHIPDPTTVGFIQIYLARPQENQQTAAA